MADEILIRFSVKDDGSPVIEKVNQKLGETTKQSKALAPGIENAKDSLATFASQNAALIGVLVGVGAAIKNVIDEGIKYAMTVDEMPRAGGVSAEEASRFIQVLDDYEISAQDAMAATRALTNNGLVPNIETLAKLSDQYRAINDPMEKNKFIIDNLGRGGLQWAKALDQGSAALIAQSKAISENLILTEKQIKQAEMARLSIDQWNDSIEGLKISFSTKLLPVFNDALTAMNNNIEKGLQWRDLLRLIAPANAILALIDLSKAHDQNTAAMAESATASVVLAQNQKELEAAEKDAKEAAKELSDMLSGRIGVINSIQSAEEAYTKKSGDLAQERQDTEKELQKLRAQGYSEQSDQIQGTLKDLDKISQKEADLARERDKQTLQFISNILAEQLARDGWTQAEFDAFAKQQQAWGLWSADVVAKARAAWQEADRITQSINNIPTSREIVITTTNVSQNYSVQGNATRSGVATPRAGGGTFDIPYGANESFMLPGGNTASGGETLTINRANQESRTDHLLSALLNKRMIDEGLLARRIVNAIQSAGG